MSETKETERTPKPKAVKIVEAFAWVYVALVVTLFATNVVVPFIRSYFDVHVHTIVETGCLPPRTFLALMLLCITLAMLRAVRCGRYAWFRFPHILLSGICLYGFFMNVVIVLNEIGVLNGLDGMVRLDRMDISRLALALVLLAVACAFVAVPLLLLSQYDAVKWGKEERARHKRDMSGAVVFICLGFLLLWGGAGSDPFHLYRAIRKTGSEFRSEGESLFQMIREKNGNWIEPADCSNSTQFVQTILGRRAEDFKSVDAWCIAVNPPPAKNFPILVSDNVDVLNLLRPSDMSRQFSLSCPAKHGGKCHFFCLDFGIVYPNTVYGCFVPPPGPDTYFLTPTGRLDLATLRAEGRRKRELAP